MHRIDTPTAVKDKFGPGKNGFTNGNLATGRRATRLNSDMWDALQEEVCGVIEKAGITLNKQEHDQLYKAIVALVSSEVGEEALLKRNNLADVANKKEATKNLGLTPTIEKAAGAVQRDGDTMSGKLNLPQTSAFGVNTDNVLGGNSITLGDNDTGIKQNGDGVLDVYANSQHVFRFVAGIINSLRSLRTEGYITATGGVYEANGNDNVRVYSPNNPPPAPNLSGYATREWVMQNTVQNIDHTAPIEVQFWDGAGYPRGTDGAAMYNISFVGGYSNVGWIHFRYTRKQVNGTWYIIA